MSQTQAPKSFDKKLKNAELKFAKILNKIESVKLNNYYLAKLQVPAKKDSSLSKKKLFYFYAFGLLMLIVVAKWIYNEWPSNGVSLSFLSDWRDAKESLCMYVCEFVLLWRFRDQPSRPILMIFHVTLFVVILLSFHTFVRTSHMRNAELLVWVSIRDKT